ncbi:hypothetical protein SAMN02949497_1209 [Methylomagnum ishizawai]|uniref:Uncharacterized protein n=1 Tax=Methylomagnum ishizawai TaxID=1760988 RepID=A0A1Y6CZB8_9GAMM|nr:hypothetical protein [Methylomagnum ishizawai]SMF93913.1 hypothetical protein SAMN02949497_1209 [Methylomagnum ishizawai]
MNPTIIAQLQGLAAGSLGGMGGHGSASGSLSDFGDLFKALDSTSAQSDVAQLTGGAALGIQSLDRIMKSTVFDQKHIVFFKDLMATNATNIVDEYTRMNSVGGFPGGSFNAQMGTVRSATGDYQREVGMVKFIMQLRQVGFVTNITNNIADAMSVEENNGALSILQDLEYALFYGHSAACPVQFDGIFKQIDDSIASGYISGEHIYDMQGTSLTDVEAFNAINSAIIGYGSWGTPTDVYLPSSVQGDLNSGLDPSYRWNPDNQNQPMIGGHVPGIRLTHGVLKTHIDTFLHDANMPMIKPFEVTYSAFASALSTITPQGVAAACASDASSQFTAGRAGNYYYAVEAIDAQGQGYSPVVKTTQTAISAGQKCTLTITASSAGTETGYRVFRSRQDAANTTGDMRLVAVVPKAGSTTTYVDLNRNIPGTFSAPIVDLERASDAIGWRQFQPMIKIPLPFGIGLMPVYSWFQFLFGYLRITNPKRHGYIKNILPANAAWRPHTDE